MLKGPCGLGCFAGHALRKKNTKKYDYDDNDGLKKWNRKEFVHGYSRKESRYYYLLKH